jgi:exonuclease V
VDLRRKYGEIKKLEKERGKEIHKDLLIEISEVIPVEIKTPADKLHTIAHNILVGVNQYKKNGITRELPVFFKFCSALISGVVDEIIKVEEEGRDSIDRRRKYKRTRVTETKTRTTNRRPSSSQTCRDKIQGMIYWYGLDSMINKNMDTKEVYTAFGIDLETMIDPETVSLSNEYMTSLNILPEERFIYGSGYAVERCINDAFREITKLPKLSSRIELRYIYQETGEEVYREEYVFDPEFFNQKMKWALDYWLGRREPIPVGERNRWKCNFCGYRDMCPVGR